MDVVNSPLSVAGAPSSSSRSGPGDSIKLFIGQVPYAFDEGALRTYFEQHVNVLDSQILRDRATGNSRGCGFITVPSRVDAERICNEFNGKHTFPGHSTNMIVRPAESDAQKLETKLFVSGIPRSADESVLRSYFEMLGTVEESFILKNNDGTSKGCGFVKFSKRSEAEGAIEQYHLRFTPPDGTQALVVRFADTEKQKAMKKGLQPGNPMMMMGGATAALGGVAGGQAAQQQMLALQAMIQQQQQQILMMQKQQQQQQQGQQQGQYGMSAQAQAQQQQQQQYMAMMNAQYPMMNGMGAGGAMGGAMGGGMGGPSANQQRAGPEGANLFILNLAPQHGDYELMQMFSAYGNVVSAKVFTDKMTGQSKCFGFVSYDNPQSATLAIAQMDGMMVPGGKRLKVQLKTKRDATNTPYAR